MSDRVGFWTALGSVVRAPFEERLAREELARADRAQAAAAAAMLEQVVRRVEPEEDDFTRALGDDTARELTEIDADTLRQNAQVRARRSTHLQGYLRSLKRFVMGSGPTITVEIEDEAVREAELAWWKQVAKLNHWDTLEDEIAVRRWRDGEIFIRTFVERLGTSEFVTPDDIGPEALSSLTRARFSIDELRRPVIPRGMVQYRIIPPEQIADPHGRVTHGILTLKDDVQTILAYLWSPDGKILREVIPAAEMIHSKVNVDSDIKRGRTQLEVLLQRDRQFEDWLKYRIMLNLARTAVVLIKKIQGSPGQVAGIRDAQTKARDTTANDRRLKMFKPMTTVHANPGIEYEFKSPNIQAQDAQHDGRALLLTMAAATGLPEYMFTGDSSNSNFASTMVSEAPAVKEFESQQDELTPLFVDLRRRAMIAAAEARQIDGLTPEMAAEVEITVEWPEMIARDELQQAQRNAILQAASILSKETWAGQAGLDWKREKDRLRQEIEDALDFGPPPPAREPESDPEPEPV